MRVRLRHKMALWMIVVGVIPTFVASFMAISLIVRRLKTNKKHETSKTLRIGTNLLMTHVEKIKNITHGLSKNHIIFDFFYENELSYQKRRLLQKEFEGMGNGIIQITDAKGRLSGSLIIGTLPSGVSVHKMERFYENSLKFDNYTLSMVLGDYANMIDIISIDSPKSKDSNSQKLYIRAGSPLLDNNFNLKGALIITMALDDLFCRNISTILGSQIILYPYPNSTTPPNSFVSSFPSYKKIEEAVSPIGGNTLMNFVNQPGKSEISEISYNKNRYSVAMHLIHNLKDQPKGIFAVATNINALKKGQSEATRTLKWITFISLAIVVVLAMLFAKTLSNPLRKLINSVKQLSKGQWDIKIESKSSDEIGDLAHGFNKMLRELARVRKKQTEQFSEIQTLHEINNSVSIQVGIENVITSAMNSIGTAIQAENIVFFLKNEDGEMELVYPEGHMWKALKNLKKSGLPLYHESLLEGKLQYFKNIRKKDIGLQNVADLKGELMVVPLKYQNETTGVFYLNRWEPGVHWSELHFRILGTVSDQLSIYIVNAKNNEKIAEFSATLEKQVQERTAELQTTLIKLQDTIGELQDTRVQVLISERLAGLGSLLAGVAHEINSPIGAIDAAIENLSRNIKSSLELLNSIADSDEDIRILSYLLTAMTNYLGDYSPGFKSTANNRVKIKNLSTLLENNGIENHKNIARKFVDMRADNYLIEFLNNYQIPSIGIYINFMHSLLSINKSSSSITMAIQSVKRIVVALRSYSHVKQDKPEWTNIHDVIETSLIILSNKLKHHITVIKEYGDIPPVKVYGDELSQVWTNLIMNGAQAIDGDGTIKIKTEVLESTLLISISDSGAGIPEHIQKKIFETFFTTKKKGEGSGLGLSIVSRIVTERHHGRIELESEPGRTTFKVYLPLNVEEIENSES